MEGIAICLGKFSRERRAHSDTDRSDHEGSTAIVQREAPGIGRAGFSPNEQPSLRP